MSERIVQRLIDPELCSACFACFEACPSGAIVIRGRRVAVDPRFCNDCGECEPECSTGAIEAKRLVESTSPYPVENQFEWDRLPPADF